MGRVLEEGAVADALAVLSKGVVVFFPIRFNASVLMQLCKTFLTGKDRLINAVEIRTNQYRMAKRRYTRYFYPLMTLSIASALASTVLAVVLDEGDESTIEFYVVIVLPSLLFVVDSLVTFIMALPRGRAADRAAGLVTKEKFCYLMHSGKYSEEQVTKQARLYDLDLEAMRRKLLEAYLHEVDRFLSAAGVVYPEVPESESKLKSSGNHKWDGDRYIKERVQTEIARVSRVQTQLMVCAMLIQIFLLLAAAIGTVLATLGNQKWVAVTVAVTTTTNRIQKELRIEENREKYAKAGVALNAAQLAWTVMPHYRKACPTSLDDLVSRVELALESILPTAEVMPQALETADDRDRKGGK
eukprot:Hpha_TRINITY_DN16934_c0_g5::TRINITY_DN16934_c0_g5_i6::g.53289::m.53289